HDDSYHRSKGVFRAWPVGLRNLADRRRVSSVTRVAMITGAGSGIGRALSIRLARCGWSLTLAGRREANLQETAALSVHEETHIATLVVPTDVTDPAQAHTLVARTVEHFGRLDALVNNAGVAPSRPIADTDPELLRHTFAVNALGPGYLIHA